MVEKVAETSSGRLHPKSRRSRSALRRERKTTTQTVRKRLTLQHLLGVADQLMKDEELTVDQQHQLRTVMRYLELEPDTTTTHGQAALRCAELLIDNVRLNVYQRRYGLVRH
jgi:hypothetical protein